MKPLTQTPTEGPTPRRLRRLLGTWLSLKQAVDWAHEQDRRRAAEQERFASQRLLARLEALWEMPARIAPTGRDPSTT